jgi:hypothetical protein
MSKNANLDPDQDLKDYRDPSGVSLREMNFGLWLAEHRRRITKIIIAFLLALSAFFFIFSSYNYIIYFLSDDPNKQLANENNLLSPRNVASNPEAEQLQIFRSNGNYDLAVKINNPNEKFLVTFKYCFSVADKGLACGDDFILPKESKYVLALGQTLSDEQTGVAFKITDIAWQRIDAHQIPNWGDFFLSRLNFSIADLNFLSATNSGLSKKVNLNTLEFTIKNETSYGYYKAPLNILFYSGSELVGVNRYFLYDFLSGEERPIKISWPGDLNAVNRTEVVPDINIIDEGVYLKYQGEGSR